jgi:hypothetical protein
MTWRGRRKHQRRHCEELAGWVEPLRNPSPRCAPPRPLAEIPTIYDIASHDGFREELNPSYSVSCASTVRRPFRAVAYGKGTAAASLPSPRSCGGEVDSSGARISGVGGFRAPAAWQLIPLCRASRRNLRARCLLVDGSRFIIGVVPPPPPFELRSNVPHDRASLDRTTARAGGRGEEKHSNAIALPQAGAAQAAGSSATSRVGRKPSIIRNNTRAPASASASSTCSSG